MCECFKQIEEAMKNKFNAYSVKADWFGKTDVRVRPIRQDGEPAERWRYEAVEWNFCPICGEPVKREKKDRYMVTLPNGVTIRFSFHHKKKR